MAARLKLSSRAEQRLTTIQPPDRAADSVAKFLSKWPTKCLEHEEPVSRFCVEHDTLICDVCKMTNHSRCNSAMDLDEASKGIRSSRECTLIEAGIKKLVKRYEKMHTEQSDILKNLQEQEKEFIKAVKQFRQELNAMLDRLEHAVMAKKDNYTTRRREAVKENKQQCKTAMTMLDTYGKELDRMYLGPDEQNLFVAIKKSKVVMQKYEEQLRKISQAPKKVTLLFTPNATIAKFFLSLKDFGEMKADQSVKDLLPVIEEKPLVRKMSANSLPSLDRISRMSSLGVISERGKTRMSLPNIVDTAIQDLNNNNPKLKTRRPAFTGEVSVHLDTDTEIPFVTGCAFMADDNVVLVDDANKNVKFFNPAFKPISVVKVSAPPLDVTPIKLQQVVVTIPTERSLQFIEVGKHMMLMKKVQMELECYGITFYNHELYVTSGFSNEREIHIVSLNGEVRKKIRPGIADLRYPLYICVDPKFRMIFVSDYNHGVVGLDVNSGEVKFKCKDTDVHGYYKGVTIGQKGHINVCTWNLHGVSRVHLDGRGLETIIPMPGKEGRKPYSIAFSKKSERLIVSLCGGKRGCLSVYRYQ